MFAKALNHNLNLQRFKFLFICGNYSSVLSRLDRRFQDLEIRRAFTVFQLMTIL
jgi:DNA polymerase I